MLGLEPQRRNRPTQAKGRVTKVTKKEVKTKKEEENIKSEPGEASNSAVHVSVEGQRQKIKPEHSSPNSASTRLPPTSGPPPSISTQMPIPMHHRLMTPCSDTDVFVTPHSMMAPSPTNDLFASQHQQPQQTFDFPPPFCGDEASNWPAHPMYSPFEPPHDFGYNMGYPPPHMQHAADMFGSQPMTDASGEGCLVKHEEWDAQC
jgi:hypothetical protein